MFCLNGIIIISCLFKFCLKKFVGTYNILYYDNLNYCYKVSSKNLLVEKYVIIDTFVFWKNLRDKYWGKNVIVSWTKRK